MRKSVVIAVLVGVDNGGASCCGYAWTSDSDRDGNGDVVDSAVGLPKTSVTKGDRSHSDGIKHARVEPGAPSAPTKPRTGDSISNSIAHCVVCTMFQKCARAKHNPQNRVCRSNAPPLVLILAENNTFRLDAYLHVFIGRIHVRPDALLLSRKHVHLEDIGFRSDSATLT